MASHASSSGGGHDTRKSHKIKSRDRPIHSVRPGAVDGPRKGGQGRGNWGRVGDEAKGGGVVGRADPNYDDEADESENGPEAAWQPAAVEKKRFSEGAADLSKYKRVVRDAAEDFLVFADLAKFLSTMKKETRAVFGQELPVILLRLALDKPAPLQSRLFGLPKHLFDHGVLSLVQITQAFRKLFNLMDEILVDSPNAEKILTAALEQSVAEGVVARAEADALITARRSLANVDAVNAAKLRIRAIVDNFWNHGDTADVRLSLTELNAPHLAFEVVKQVVQSALDKKDEQRELASVFLAELSDLLKTDEIAKAFTILLARVEDLYLDVPDILRLLSAFLARAIQDEAVPRAFLLRVDLPAGDSSNQVVQQASKLLAVKGCSTRLARIWGATLDGAEADGAAELVSPSKSALRRLRAKKSAAAAKGLDPSKVKIVSAASPTAVKRRTEQKLKVGTVASAQSVPGMARPSSTTSPVTSPITNKSPSGASSPPAKVASSTTTTAAAAAAAPHAATTAATIAVAAPTKSAAASTAAPTQSASSAPAKGSGGGKKGKGAKK